MVRTSKTAMLMRDILMGNSYLFALFGIGIILMSTGIAPEYRETVVIRTSSGPLGLYAPDMAVTY